ncbi:auxin response factor 19 [Tanacetum coccineum]
MEFITRKMADKTSSINDRIPGNRSYKQDYTFSYADLPRLNLNDIEGMYLLKVQDKMRHLPSEDEKDFNNALLLFIRRTVIKNRVEDLQLGVESYQKTLNLTKPKLYFEGIDEKIQYTMTGIEKGVNDKDVKKSKEMVDKIDQVMKRREQLRRLEEYVRGRPKTINPCDHRDIETQLSAATDISPQSFGMPADFVAGCSNDNIDDNGGVGNGLWGNQTTQRMRTYTKVLKRGSIGRKIDVTEYKGYEELRHDLARMFGIEGQLEGMEWKLVYVDHENDILLVGDDPWEEFVSCVQIIKILSYSQVQKMSLDGDLGNVPPMPNPTSSGTNSGNLYGDDNLAASFNR